MVLYEYFVSFLSSFFHIVLAMYSQKPIIAVASGGPLESVVDGITGFLCPRFIKLERFYS